MAANTEKKAGKDSQTKSKFELICKFECRHFRLLTLLEALSHVTANTDNVCIQLEHDYAPPTCAVELT